MKTDKTKSCTNCAHEYVCWYRKELYQLNERADVLWPTGIARASAFSAIFSTVAEHCKRYQKGQK